MAHDPGAAGPAQPDDTKSDQLAHVVVSDGIQPPAATTTTSRAPIEEYPIERVERVYRFVSPFPLPAGGLT